MKIKYLFSMVAGLIVLATASCKEEATTQTDGDGDKASSGETAEAATPDTPETADTPDPGPGEAPSAYYVMFKGDGG